MILWHYALADAHKTRALHNYQAALPWCSYLVQEVSYEASIYRSGVRSWMLSVLQLVWCPYPQHCYHVEREDLCLLLGVLKHLPRA
jgi:hypothetical protein